MTAVALRQKQLLLAIAALSALVSFYIFARTTVEDAFITWRYGKNLIESGVWNYNPSSFDLTQAYTNPIYAILSILPAALGMDMVLFFKLISLATLALPCLLIYRPGVDRLRFATMYLFFLALPATMIHAFSGLETFLFTALLALLFVALLEARFWPAIVLTGTLLLVRPESWVLLGLVPAYIFITPAFAPRFKRTSLAAAILISSFALYALFHYLHFGHVLPNTFYIKAVVPFNWKVIVYFLAYLLPLGALWFTPHRRLALFIAAFYLPMMVSYSSADLQMNFSARFAFHIWAPIFLLMSYIIAARAIPNLRIHRLACLTTFCTAILFIYYSSIYAAGNHLIANVYPRMLNAHAAIGKTLARSHALGETKIFSLGDAGAAAFHSGFLAFDNVGLGSALVAHQGTTDAVINQYNPDVVILVMGLTGEPMIGGNQPDIFRWRQAKKIPALCDVLAWKGYTLRVFSKHPITGMQETCDRSQHANSPDQATFFRQNIKQPPWAYWHE